MSTTTTVASIVQQSPGEKTISVGGSAAAGQQYPYDHLLPNSDRNLQLPPLKPFEHEDPGKRVLDPLRNPLKDLLGDSKVTDLTPSIGTEVTGVQLSQLTSAQKDELAVLVARRGVVVFRDQDFVDQHPEKLREFGRYFGPLHIHPTSMHPEGYPEFHLVYRDGSSSFNHDGPLQNRISSHYWHSDVSYELQPPGLTALAILALPRVGGDTMYASQVEAYNRLSPEFQKRLHGLRAVHSGVAQADYSRAGHRGGIVRREPVEHEHPLVRIHPVTGEKALYVNPQFTRHIVGYKREESDMLLNFLYDHIAKGIDFQLRVKWEAKSVTLWDNRVTIHSALVDFKEGGERRHALRITPQAERPVESLEEFENKA